MQKRSIQLIELAHHDGEYGSRFVGVFRHRLPLPMSIGHQEGSAEQRKAEEPLFLQGKRWISTRWQLRLLLRGLDLHYPQVQGSRPLLSKREC